MIMRIQIALVFAAAVALSGCSPGISDGNREASAGSADFSVFVALGDSLSAGYRDGALFRDGQVLSFPAIMAQQFEQVGGGSYSQPLMPVGATGSLTFMGTPIPGRIDRLVLTGDPLGIGTITPTQSTAIDVPIPGPYNDMAVPGARFYHLPVAGYGNPAALPNASPYFIRSASSTAASMLGDTLSQAPTFFVLWIGGNDLLDYAADGGTGIDQTGNPDPTGYGPKDITDPGYFANGFGAAPSYSDTVAMLTMSGAKGVIVNIPDIQSIPYFTAVPYNAIPLDATLAAAANAGFADYNDTVQGQVLPAMSRCPFKITQEEADRRKITFTAGANPVVILDENLTDLTLCDARLLSMRQATADDLILLPTASKLGEDAPSPPYAPGSIWGISAPLLDEDVLIDTEIAAVKAAQQAINATIKDVADASTDLAFYDVAARLKGLNDSGIDYGSGRISGDFPTGGGFSLDGIHPTARTSALIANDLFSLINSTFDAYIPGVDPNDYPTVPIQ